MINRIIITKERKNSLLLLASFALGQGSLFLAQNYIYYADHLSFMVMFSVSFAMAILFSLIVDGGGLVILTRRLVSNEHRHEEGDLLSRHISSIVAVRFTICSILIIGICIYYFESDNVDRYYYIWAVPGLFVYCFNIAGVLDALYLSGLGGVAGCAPYLISAIALPVAAHWDAERAAALCGIMFSVGMLVTVALQYTIIVHRGVSLALVRPTYREIKSMLGECIQYQLSFLPGQLLYRGQLLIAGIMLPVSEAALFVYGKQISNACLQIVGFVRRASFPTLIQHVRLASDSNTRRVLNIQKDSILASLIFSLSMFLAGIAVETLFSESSNRTAIIIMAMAPTVISSAIFSAYSQYLQAFGSYIKLSLITVFVAGGALGGGMILSWGCAVYGLILAETLGHVIGVWAIVLLPKVGRWGGCGRSPD